MPRLTKVIIRRFKRLEELSLDLSDVNVLIGANNSGKSSILQAIHFAVSVAQTAKLVGGIPWRQDSYELSFNPTQLLYSPVSDVMALATGGSLVEDRNKRVEIIFHADDGSTSIVAVRRGRNRNIAVAIEGRILGEQLQDIRSPFSVYAPGLAGVPREELFMSSGRVRRVVARGDANLVLRNVLLMLQKDRTAWDLFSDDLCEVFPGLHLTVAFQEETEEHIDARFSISNGPSLPIDSAGTSILQAAQLLSYVTLFKPSLFILDEPDSHLHPDNQRTLCRLVSKLARDREVQIILSTHSRHVLDALRGRSSTTWLSRGEIVPPTEDGHDTTALLLDLGALDSVDYFTDGETRFVVATEDEDTSFVKTLLWSSGFDEDNTEVVSYAGCSKVDSAIVLGSFLKDKAPNVQMIVHRDRDYLPQEQLNSFADALSKHGILPFLTEGNDVEWFFVNADHLAKCNNGITKEGIEELIEQAISETSEKSIEAIINLRTEEAFRERNRGGDPPNHGRIGTQAHAEYQANPKRMMRGKVVLKRLKALIQQELGCNARVLVSTEYISVPALRSFIEQACSQCVIDQAPGISSDSEHNAADLGKV